MPSTATDRLNGLTTSVAVKPPCKVATSAAITLSGEQTVNSVAVVSGDRVLVKNQADTTQNGIYIANTSAWTRAPDFDGTLDAVNGTIVLVNNDSDAYFYRAVATNPVVVGTSAVTFEPALVPSSTIVPVTSYGATGDGSDETSAIATAVAAAEGKILYFPMTAAGGVYLTGRILPLSNTTLLFDPGVILRKKSGGVQVIKVAGKSNVHIIGNGCTFDGQTNADASSGDTVNFSDSHDCSMTNVHVLGAGTAGSDCIYIGSDGNDEPCTNIRIVGGSCTNGKRNGISVAAGFDILIDGVEISGTTGNPGAGIDVEANVHGMVGNVVICNCNIHDNEDWGINIVFGDDVSIHHNRIYDNGKAGVATGAGGTQFNAGVARSNIDIRAVSAVASGTGKLTISGASTLAVGTIVVPTVRGAGVRPTGCPTSQCFVFSNDGTDVILSSTGVTGVTSFSDSGSGTFTTDPTTSEFYLVCYEAGQSSNVRIYENHCWDNGGTRGEIDVTSGVNISVFSNILEPGVDNGGVFCSSSRGVVIRENQINGDTASTSASARGIHLSISSDVETVYNRIRDFSGVGLNASSVMTPGSWVDDRITNCGSVGAYMVKLENVDRARLRGTRCRTDGGYTVTNGISAFSAVTNSTLDGADCKGVASSNATSISWSGTGNRVDDSIQFDGTYYLTGSATYDAASLADGAGATSTITVTGAALGDFAEVSFGVSLQGMTLTAYVSAANTVTFRLQNETGGAIDLASTTVRARVRKP